MKFLVLMSLFSLVSCGAFSRMGANITGNSFECVNGVEYIQFPSGVTVSYRNDGSIKTCD
jgi:hypothetical protein